MTGLGELFSVHPGEARAHAGAILERLVERFDDPDPAVRKELRTMLREVLLPALEAATLAPFIPLIMAHVCSAMTHVILEIRMDALGLLEALMEAAPALVGRQFLAPSLQHFSDLLSAAHRSRSIRAQSVKALLKVITNLTGFLRRAFAAGGDGADGGGGGQPAAPGAPLRPASQAAPALFRHRCDWPPGVVRPEVPRDPLAAAAAAAAPGGAAGTSSGGGAVAAAAAALVAAPATVTSLTAGASNPGAGHVGSAQAAAQAATAVSAAALQLLRQLLDCWAECAPAQLSSAPEPEAAATLLQILHASLLLVRHTGLLAPAGDGGRGVAALAELVGRRVGPFFPATAPAVKPPQALLDTLMQYNLQCASLLAALLAAEHAATGGAGGGGAAPAAAAHHGAAAAAAQQVRWRSALLEYYVGASPLPPPAAAVLISLPFARPPSATHTRPTPALRRCSPQPTNRAQAC